MGKRLTGWVLCVAVVGGCSGPPSSLNRKSDGQAELSEAAACWTLPLEVVTEGDTLRTGDWIISNWSSESGGFSRTETSAKHRLVDNIWSEGRENDSLRLVHRRTGAVIEFSSAAASRTDERIDLDILLRRTVDRLRGNRAIFGAWGAPDVVGSVERRIAAREGTPETLEIAGLPAVREDVEFIDLDHLTLDPNNVYYRTRMIVVRTPFNRLVDTSSDRDVAHAIVRISLSSHPSVHEGHFADFQRIVEKMHVVSPGDKVAFRLGGCLPKDKPAEAAKKAN
jgi:hypothetical protein